VKVGKMLNSRFVCRLHAVQPLAKLVSFAARARHLLATKLAGQASGWFTERTTEPCRFCEQPTLVGSIANYNYCPNCDLLQSPLPPPDYAAGEIYRLPPDFIYESICHFRRLLAAYPEIGDTIARHRVTMVYDLAGGYGFFPRIVQAKMPDAPPVSIVDCGAYQDDVDFIRLIAAEIPVVGEVRYMRQDIFDFLAGECGQRPLISVIHFLDHLPRPEPFLRLLREFTAGKNALIFLYLHALEGFTGSGWMAINTLAKGEHQAIYSYRFLHKLLAQQFTILTSSRYNNDQFFLLAGE
jgi:hypothetical protein